MAQQGYSVLGIRLAGHATSIEDMRRTHWWDWVASVEDGYRLLEPNTNRIVVIGLSMGGILSLYTAARFKVDGAIALSTPYNLPKDWRFPYIKIIGLVKKEISKGPSDWHDPQVAKNHVAYNNYPTQCIPDLALLMGETHKILPDIQCPVLLMQSKADKSIIPESMQSYFDMLGTKDKNMFWLENSGHIITNEPESNIVFESCSNFIRRVTGG